MKKRLLLMMAMVFLLAMTSLGHAVEVGLGGGYHSGHSWSGDYSVDPGFSFYGTIESGGEFSFGVMYMYSNWTRTNNDPIDKEQINSRKALGFVRYYPVFFEKVKPFVMVGGGYEMADDKDSEIGTVGGGVVYWITENLGIETNFNYMLRPDRNYPVILFGGRFTF